MFEMLKTLCFGMILGNNFPHCKKWITFAPISFTSNILSSSKFSTYGLTSLFTPLGEAGKCSHKTSTHQETMTYYNGETQ
jgi:hypothetical protein